MNIGEAIDRAVKAKWRADLINMLADAGRTLEHANLRANGNVYQDINVGLLLLEAARSLQECQSELEPENPDDVVVKVEVPDRWPMTEAGQRRAAQEAAAPKPMTNGDRIRAMTDEELAESDELLSGLCNVLHGQGYPCEANTCRECLIKWLGSPEKEAAPEPVTSGIPTSGGSTTQKRGDDGDGKLGQGGTDPDADARPAEAAQAAPVPVLRAGDGANAGMDLRLVRGGGTDDPAGKRRTERGGAAGDRTGARGG